MKIGGELGLFYADISYKLNLYREYEIGDITINLFHYNRIGTIIKHIPGHGLAKKDSHLKPQQTSSQAPKELISKTQLFLIKFC